ncbi:glutamate decarboxylase [Coprinopsis sp. MPI-PUGE-AT-0042]|nr:glutamate decarboxylase [Coprinopsis sp. MPI-PUGE-AT-0042]
MSLSRHIDADELIQKVKEHPHKKHSTEGSRRGLHQSWRRDEDASSVPKYKMPPVGIPSKSAYQLLHDETALDGNPLLNLASFVHTWMPEEANKLYMENLNKNLVDLDEYPAATTIHNRCISMIADLWKVPKVGKVFGTATAGSSEAIMLGGLAMKRRWQEDRKAAGKDHYHPNIVFGSNAQVALEKFARYFDVECRLVPVKAENGFIMNPQDAIPYIDENTIGVIVILGSTYTGHFEDVALMGKLRHAQVLNVPIHVDAASGGFDVPRVVSINTSGHKFGLGLNAFLHKDLSTYLGSTEYTFTAATFSKPAAPVIAQMFNFLNLGFDGYKKIAWKDLPQCADVVQGFGCNIHKPISTAEGDSSPNNHHNGSPEGYEPGLPVVAFRLSDKFKEEYPHVKQVWLSHLLRTKGWIVPNYNAPAGAEDIELLRVVVRETLSEDLVERLIVDILEITESLMDSATTVALPGEMAKTKRNADHEHGRPDPEKFGDGDGKPGNDLKEQVGFSSQC